MISLKQRTTTAILEQQVGTCCQMLQSSDYNCDWHMHRLLTTIIARPQAGAGLGHALRLSALLVE